MTPIPKSEPRRGEIWLVNFDPSIGDEQMKIRPAVVVSVSSAGRLALRIVVPVTTWQARFERVPWFVKLPATRRNGLDAESGADTFQVKSVSVERFHTRLGEVATDQLDEIAAGVALCVGFRPRP